MAGEEHVSSSDPQSLAGLPVLGADGVPLGQVHQVYVDVTTGRLAWVAVNAEGQLCLVPLAAAQLDGDGLRVPYDQAQLLAAPTAPPGQELSAADQDRLAVHYGLPAQPAGPPVGDGQEAGQVDAGGAMTRSEEQLVVGVERRETGRARLRKYVVTENVTRTFQVSHEEVRLEREPINDAGWEHDPAGPGLTEEDHEVILHEERLVIGTETVPTERVRMVTEIVAEDRTVSEELRKEQIAYETAGPPAA